MTLISSAIEIIFVMFAIALLLGGEYLNYKDKRKGSKK